MSTVIITNIKKNADSYSRPSLYIPDRVWDTCSKECNTLQLEGWMLRLMNAVLFHLHLWTQTSFLNDGPASNLVITQSTTRFNDSLPDCISACVAMLLDNKLHSIPFHDSDFSNMSSPAHQV